MKVAIMTDTNSSITIEEGKRDGIFLMTLPVIIGDKTYIEGENLSTKELYQGMADGVPVKTSQPSPQDLMDMWQSILDEGYDEIVYIPMTLTLSSSYSTAAAFAQEFDGKVQVVNNYRLSSMLYEAVYDAKAYVGKGMSAKEIKEKLESESKNSFMVLTGPVSRTSPASSCGWTTGNRGWPPWWKIFSGRIWTLSRKPWASGGC